MEEHVNFLMWVMVAFLLFFLILLVGAIPLSKLFKPVFGG
jgi:hypothetical protein